MKNSGMPSTETGQRLIVARLNGSSEREVADLFAASDGGDLARTLGVTRRDLFAYQGLYFHLVEFDGDPEVAMATARDRTDFRALCADLDPYVRPYDPSTWRGPRDAMARCFYHWKPAGAVSR